MVVCVIINVNTLHTHDYISSSQCTHKDQSGAPGLSIVSSSPMYSQEDSGFGTVSS